MGTGSQEFVVAATGLLFEARIAEHSKNVMAVAGGGNGAQLERRLLEAARIGASGVVSFGVAGALDPDLRAGDICVCSAAVTQNGSFSADERWLKEFRARVPDAKTVRSLASNVPVSSAREKAARFAATGCQIADMESHIAGRVAQKLGLPFAVIRVISDPAHSDLPPAALVGMRADGGTDVPAVLASLARHPRQLPSLIQLAAATAKARSSLLRCVRLLGPGLGGINLR